MYRLPLVAPATPLLSPAMCALMFREKKARATKSSVNENSKLFAIITELENSPSKGFSVSRMCERFSVKRRVFYDFLSILSVFGICIKTANEHFHWNSLNISEDVINGFRNEVEAQSHSMNIKEIFDCAEDSSLQYITKSLIQLFMYLGVTSIDLKAVGKLFAQGNTKFNTMLRKLYTVCSCLEILGVTVRTKKAAEMKLVRVQWVFNNNQNPIGINALLNSNEDKASGEIYAERRSQFQQYISYDSPLDMSDAFSSPSPV